MLRTFALLPSLTMVRLSIFLVAIIGGGGSGVAAAVLSNPSIFELRFDIHGCRHSIHCLWNGLEDRYDLPTSREIMGRVIEGLSNPDMSGRSRTVTVDISPPEAVVGQQHPTLVEHVSGKVLEAIRNWHLFQDVVIRAIEDCFNGANRAEIRPVGVHVQNVLEETETVSSMSSGAMSLGSS
jgi:hypothetical protein